MSVNYFIKCCDILHNLNGHFKCNQVKYFQIHCCVKNHERKLMSDFWAIAVSADGLAPLNALTYWGREMKTMIPYVCIRPIAASSFNGYPHNCWCSQWKRVSQTKLVSVQVRFCYITILHTSCGDIQLIQIGVSTLTAHLHIEVETKWQPFHRRHFEVCFLEWKLSNLKQNFTEICFSLYNWRYVGIGSDNGLMPNRWQAIIWTNDGLVQWGIYALLSLIGLMHP